jgi:hypothetical protein
MDVILSKMEMVVNGIEYVTQLQNEIDRLNQCLTTSSQRVKQLETLIGIMRRGQNLEGM